MGSRGACRRLTFQKPPRHARVVVSEPAQDEKGEWEAASTACLVRGQPAVLPTQFPAVLGGGGGRTALTSAPAKPRLPLGGHGRSRVPAWHCGPTTLPSRRDSYAAGLPSL